MSINSNLIFSRSKGNKISRSIKVFFEHDRYKLVYMRFDRTDPLIKDKLKGVKPKRILLDKKVYYIEKLSMINVDTLPSKDLTTKFLESMI